MLGERAIPERIKDVCLRHGQDRPRDPRGLLSVELWGSVMQVETAYARSGNVHIAYQVVGRGPLDLVYVPGWVSHVELAWEEPILAHFLHRLASFSRLITFDRRGSGLSDRVPDNQMPTLEVGMDDLQAVMDAVGSERAALFAVSDGGSLSTLFAATHPERTTALITFGCFAKRIWSPDYPWAPTPEKREQEYGLVERERGSQIDLSRHTPSEIDDEEFALLRMNTQIDIRHVLPAIRVPTLVIHRTGDWDSNVEEGRWIAARIPGARFVELPGDDHLPWVGDQDTILDEIQGFLSGVRPSLESDRALATVLFTDIVSSTEWAARLGDRAWREILERHHGLVRKELGRFRGREVDTAGDRFFATFDGPARAIRCACTIRDGVRQMGIEVRAGVHTGEIDLAGERVGGLAVHIGARVAASAQASEVLVSRTVKDLVAGSGIHFTDRGPHLLKGVPGEWTLFAAT
jgi:pimeloyl-ACP methyl ester carboxylesterase